MKGKVSMCWEQKAKTIQEQATTEAVAKKSTDDGTVRVQGKTLEEWKEVGKQNEHLPEALHVHPKHPKETGEDRLATEEETEAFVNSMTIEEAIEGLGIILGVSAFA